MLIFVGGPMGAIHPIWGHVKPLIRNPAEPSRIPRLPPGNLEHCKSRNLKMRTQKDSTNNGYQNENPFYPKNEKVLISRKKSQSHLGSFLINFPMGQKM